MIRSISASAATKRRGAALAAAVGILTLGAASSASAVGLSHSATERTVTEVSECGVPDPGAGIPGGPTAPSVPTVPSKPSKPTAPSVPTVPAKPAKGVTATAAGKLAKLAGVEGATNNPDETPGCDVPGIPTEEGVPNSQTPSVPVTPAKK